MGRGLDKGTLYVGRNATSLVVKYFSERENRWKKSSRSFMCAGRNCSERTVRDLSELAASVNSNISSFETMDGMEAKGYFFEAVERSYKFYVGRRKNDLVVKGNLLNCKRFL